MPCWTQFCVVRQCQCRIFRGKRGICPGGPPPSDERPAGPGRVAAIARVALTADVEPRQSINCPPLTSMICPVT